MLLLTELNGILIFLLQIFRAYGALFRFTSVGIESPAAWNKKAALF